MFEHKSRVLLILHQDVLDRARILAGKATTSLKLPVSLQIVLRALIQEGLKREGDQRLLANIAAQAKAVRRIRSLARKAGGGRGTHTAPVGHPPKSGGAPTAARREGRRLG